MAYSKGRSGGSGSSREAVTPGPTALFELLADDERQVIVQYLLSQSEAMIDVDDLVDVLVTSFGHERTHAVIRLRHDHLPRLAHNEILDYDRKRGLVWFDEQTDHADHDDLRTFLELAADLSAD